MIVVLTTPHLLLVSYVFDALFENALKTCRRLSFTSDVSCAAIGKALKLNKGLKSLDLRTGDEETFENLVESLQTNPDSRNPQVCFHLCSLKLQ